MLSKCQKFSEQVSNLQESIVSHMSKINQDSKAVMSKVQSGDESVDTDQVLSDFVQDFIYELEKHDPHALKHTQIINAESVVTPGDEPSKVHIKKQESKLNEYDELAQKAHDKEKESQQVIIDLYEVLHQSVANLSKMLRDKQKQLDFINDNKLLQSDEEDEKDQSSKFLVKSSSKLFEQSFSQQNIATNLDDQIQKLLKQQIDEVRSKIDSQLNLLDKFQQDLISSSQLTADRVLKGSQNKPTSSKIKSRWSQLVSGQIQGNDLITAYPDNSKFDDIQAISLPEIKQLALCSFKFAESEHQDCDEYGEEQDSFTLFTWQFGFKDGSKSVFDTYKVETTVHHFDQFQKPVKEVKIFSEKFDYEISGIKLIDWNNQIIVSAGKCVSLKGIIELERGEVIIDTATRNHEDKSSGRISDIKLLLVTLPIE